MKEIGSEAELQKLWEKEQALVVEWYTSWCAPCKALKPLMVRLEKEYPTVKFVQVDCDKLRTMSNMMDIRSVPTIMFISYGRLVRTSVGLVSEATLRRNISEIKPKQS